LLARKSGATQCREVECPYGVVGDRIWPKEAWSLVKPLSDPDTGHVDEFEEWEGKLPAFKPPGWVVTYRADWGPGYEHPDDRLFRWRSPMFMPRWASRLLLEITSVRVERLQAITHEDAVAEGFGEHLREKTADAPHGRTWGRLGFSQYWDQLNGKPVRRKYTDDESGVRETIAVPNPHRWASDPWVWALTFKVIEGG
jgi:hypothetical protein